MKIGRNSPLSGGEDRTAFSSQIRGGFHWMKNSTTYYFRTTLLSQIHIFSVSVL